MRSEGTPMLVRQGVSRVLEQVKIGGSANDKDEKWLQELVHRHPECIPMDEIEPGFSQLVPVCMELPLPSGGYVDNLFMTPDGDIVIVETKLWRNPEARREVIAQALDYASSLFKIDYGELERLVSKAGGKSTNNLYELFEGTTSLDEAAFVDAVNINLRKGRIVVLIVGDGIRTELEDLATRLQSHAGFHFSFSLVELGPVDNYFPAIIAAARFQFAI